MLSRTHGKWLDPLRIFKRKLKLAMRHLVGRQIALTRLHRITSDSVRQLPVLCISLPLDTAKRNYMRKQSRKAGFEEFRFIAAVDGRRTSTTELIAQGLYDDELARRYEGRSLTAGDVATTLSHAKAHRTVVSEMREVALILEDDAVFQEDRLNSIDLSLLPAGWDVCLLEAWLRDSCPRDVIHGNIFGMASYRGGAGAYLLSLNGARKLLSVSRPVIHPGDGAFTWYNRHLLEPNMPWHERVPQSLNVFLLYPFPVVNGSLSGHWRTPLRAGVVY